MEEFVSSDILRQEKTRAAIETVLYRLPEEVAKDLTGRAFPVIFIQSYTTTIARFARSQAFFVEPDEPPVFTQGFYIITLADELEVKGSVDAIAGIVAHELAHKYLEHLKSPAATCEAERAANGLIKAWGFEDQLLAAQSLFGARNKSDSRCFDETPR
jgi:hypothetical protein